MEDRSAESLLARWALAAKATQGRWETIDTEEEPDPEYRKVVMATREDDHSIHSFEIIQLSTFGKVDDINFIAANSPQAVMADIDEILRLRDEVKYLQGRMSALTGSL